VVVAYIFENGVLNLLATRGTGIPVVVVEMSDPLRQRRRDVWVGLRRLTYPWAARVVSPSRGTDSRFRWLPDHRRAVIHNPLPDVDRPGEVLFPRDGRRRIVGLARLVHEKGFDLLIPAFARLAWAHPDWDLWIVGEGAQRRRLERLVEAHGLQGRVFLPGSMVNPFPLLKAANLFALSSRFEGMAGALVEALACGIPAVSFDCPSGPAEIIREGIDGTLVPPEDEQALAAALARLMRDDALRVQMGARAVEVRGRFHVDHIVRQWEAVFEDLITRQPSGAGSIP
jgi:glycosyltransferase involved in cell wall biosynthesis